MKKNHSLPERETCYEDLDFSLACAFSPLESFVDTLIENKGSHRDAEVFDALLSYAKLQLDQKINFIYDRIGIIRIVSASYNNSHDIPGGTMLGVKLIREHS